jgi:oligoribonuclease
MAQDANNLIWLDMEMSGLDPDRDRILEVAIVVTNSNLDIVARR